MLSSKINCILMTHNSGVTCECHYYLVLSAESVDEDTAFYLKGKKAALIIVKILGSSVNCWWPGNCAPLICGQWTGKRPLISFVAECFGFPCQYHSTIAPYPSIHLPPTLYNVFLPALQFPLSLSFHHCSIPIHPSTTHAV